ncbi:response regulator transcription factor [Nocardia asteroides]
MIRSRTARPYSGRTRIPRLRTSTGRRLAPWRAGQNCELCERLLLRAGFGRAPLADPDRRGVCRRLLRGRGVKADSVHRALTRHGRPLARKTLGARKFAAAVARGESLRPESHEVHRLALGTLPPAHPAAAPGDPHPAPWRLLTRAEQDVAILAAAGWQNAAIAARRGSSPKTVDAQVAAILRKLSISSRQHISASIPARLAARVETEVARRPPRRG